MGEQGKRPFAGALRKARLQAPDFLHVGGVAARDGEHFHLGLDDLFHGLIKRRDGPFARSFKFLRNRQHFMPQQGGEQEGRGNRLVFLDAQIGLVQGHGDEALSHGLFQDHVQQGQDAMVQAFGAQLLEAALRVAGKEQLENFVEQARGRYVFQQGSHLRNRRARGGVEVEFQLGDEARGAQHAHRVFLVAGARVADDAQHAVLDVLIAVDVVPDFAAGRVVEQGVDGEVAAQGVFELAAENVVAQDAAVFIGDVAGFPAGGFVFILRACRRAAKSRYLDGFGAAHHVHQTEAAPDDARAPEQMVHLFRRGVGGDVIILGGFAQQQVAHRTTDHESSVTGALEFGCDLDGTWADLVAANAVLFFGNDLWLGVLRGCGERFAENFANEFAYHGFKGFIDILIRRAQRLYTQVRFDDACQARSALSQCLSSTLTGLLK